MTRPMLEALDLAGVRGERRLFDHLTFRIVPGECLSVHGENGSGKTTLLRTLAGFATPAAGRVLWKGKPLRNQWSEYQRELVYNGHGIGLKEDLNALDNLLAAAAIAGEPVTTECVESALDEVGLAEHRHLPFRMLSQGQKRRASLARLLLYRRKLWILDEPSTALDQFGARWLGELIHRHQSRGGMVVLTSHQELALKTSQTVRMGA
ncbi:TPA: cytochrome c biogenesis heme-transporting ATPase CcmA [Pseudomonas aeruginosa]|uniref:Cytochrome c biogenesis ATP-binding export protein CcmA 1 n=10 Tax=Pseudomonadota TaxID=1224 RepID=CCMA1_CUPMC|nr:MULTISPECIES: cytochrome c biogenesis heme-transporting ATPase CcmA [Pseudomonadota]Q1LKR4.1 RecName: Full=Cytochrome c biogenesis ATP-binding export protein CcmA 1; AltName: Full=Heme exporter protein A 1 [Cupriavidus metallidurans CH34]MBF8161458.1 cytochrome c biogenesis heme-transporting ATPase CcmA [Pseudomonas mendocina]MBU63900.1 cytochrome c biogenesis ATP-binding export protein CcmA 1 [Cupriavidus sp.]HCL2587890.1 cytochrome c biogenesis heme-transporting ATPase CcmA [Pseudomonas ae